METAGDKDHHFALVYRLTREDIAAFESLPKELSGRAKLAMLAPLLAVGAAGGWIASELGFDIDSWNLWQEIGVVLAACAIWFVAVSAVLTIGRYRRIARFALPDGEVRLTADRGGLEYDEGNGMTRYPWSDIPWVHLGAAHVFLQTAARKALIVPQRAFDDADAMGRFAAFADAASQAAS